MADKNKNIKVPWGAWDLDGNWFHNEKLKMSAVEQLRRNIDSGYLCGISLKRPEQCEHCEREVQNDR